MKFLEPLNANTPIDGDRSIRYAGYPARHRQR